MSSPSSKFSSPSFRVRSVAKLQIKSELKVWQKRTCLSEFVHVFVACTVHKALD